MTVAIRIEYSVGNAQGAQAVQSLAMAMERAGDNVKELGRYVFPRLIPVFETALKEQFMAEGRGPYAGPWAPLSAKYSAWKAVHYPGTKKLVRTGNLKAALTDSTSPFASREYSATEFAFGSQGLDYGSFHQTGTRTMPGRPPFDFGADVETRIQKAAQLGIIDAIRAADRDGLLGVA